MLINYNQYLVNIHIYLFPPPPCCLGGGGGANFDGLGSPLCSFVFIIISFWVEVVALVGLLLASGFDVGCQMVYTPPLLGWTADRPFYSYYSDSSA